MSDLLKQHFRATNGLDAGGNKLINVALADRNVKTDGVSVEYMVQENTIQDYDDTRGYLKDFAITYGRRIWIANKDINAPAGPFNPSDWTSLRVDPNWIYTVAKGNIDVQSGQFINVDTNIVGNAVMVLPASPVNGDTIVIRDVGGKPGYNGLLIRTRDIGSSIFFADERVRELKVTRPYSQVLLSFNNNAWRAMLTTFGETAKTIVPQGTAKSLVQSGDNVVRRYTSNNEIFVGLPQFSNTGDIIKFSDMDGTSPINHLTISTFDDKTSIGTVGQTSMQFRTAGSGFIAFDAVEQIWRVYENDLRTRVRIITDDVTMLPNEHISVFGIDNATVKTINVTLPTEVAPGDNVIIAMNYMRKGQTVVIKPSGGDTIATDINLLQFPKRSEYPPDTKWVQSTSLTFNGDTDYVPVLSLSYIEEFATGEQYWIVSESNPTVERVDSKDNNTRKRLGVIALASQAQANIEFDKSPAKELAITPETLSNRRAAEDLRGIARIATTAEVNKLSTDTYDNDTIVSPKKLNERTATETRRGLAEIATTQKMDAGTDDTTIVTPKKLLGRTGDENRLGVVQLVKQGGKPAVVTSTDRNIPGTEVYDFNDNKKVVSPKTLSEYKATENASGIIWLATDTEVRNGTPATVGYPIVVTPSSLHKKVSTDTHIGLIATATQDEVNTGSVINKAVTPKTLNDRTATDTRTGIARFATATEFEDGLSETLLINPKLLRNKFIDESRILANNQSGLVITGNLWDHYNISISEASTSQKGSTSLATQTEVDLGVDTKKIVTPATLASKKATEGADGIIRLATQTEVNAGLINNKAVSPVHLKYVAQTSLDWQATDLVRGTVKMSKGASTWTGDQTNGADTAVKEQSGLAVSPYELRFALNNYLPKLGKAFDSGLLGGFGPTSYARRDIDQTIAGAWTFDKNTQVTGDLTVKKNLIAAGGEIHVRPTVKTAPGNIRFMDDVQGTVERGLLYASSQTADAGAIKIDVQNGTGTTSTKQTFTFNGTGSFNAPVEVTTSRLYASKEVSAGQKVLVNDVQMLTVEGNNAVVGAQSHSAYIRTKNADTDIFASDGTNWPILTTKNSSRLLDPRFVKKSGDTMTGPLSLTNASVISAGNVSWALLDTVLDASKGMWSIAVSDSATYNKLPGYMIPERAEDPSNPGSLIVASYREVKAPGTLSQFGTEKINSYQIWAPRPTAQIPGDPTDLAETFWIRQMNPITNKFGLWGRMYTSSLPPLATDIGATSSVGAKMRTLEVEDWIKLGPVKIWPDRVNQTLKFEWVGD